MFTTARDEPVPWLGRGEEQSLLRSLLDEVAHMARRWYLVATDDHMIPPPLQRTMAERAGSTVAEKAGSHSIYVSQPQAVADLIAQAARLSRPAAATLQVQLLNRWWSATSTGETALLRSRRRTDDGASGRPSIALAILDVHGSARSR